VAWVAFESYDSGDIRENYFLLNLRAAWAPDERRISRIIMSMLDVQCPDEYQKESLSQLNKFQSIGGQNPLLDRQYDQAKKI
jgi:hypothetical protein